MKISQIFFASNNQNNETVRIKKERHSKRELITNRVLSFIKKKKKSIIIHIIGRMLPTDIGILWLSLHSFKNSFRCER